jgi:hypothetical protein
MKTVAEQQAELDALRASGSVTEVEYQSRRSGFENTMNDTHAYSARAANTDIKFNANAIEAKRLADDAEWRRADAAAAHANLVRTRSRSAR